VRDASATVGAADEALRAELPAALVVWNKCDLLSAFATRDTVDDVSTSALTGAGVDRLLAAIAARLVPIEIPPGAAIPFTSDQILAIDRILEAAQRGDAMLATSLLAEWID
jgi:50S ribosomal subunit-associated GTPase HflX